MELLDRLVRAGDVGEGRLGRVLGDQLRLGLAEVEDPAAAALHLGHEQQEQDHQDRDRQQVDQEAQQNAVLRHLLVEGLDLVGLLRRHELVVDLVAGLGRVLREDLVGLGIANLDLVLQIKLEILLTVLLQRLLDVAIGELRYRDRGVGLGVILAPGEETAQRDRADDHEDDPHHRPAEDATGTFHAV